MLVAADIYSYLLQIYGPESSGKTTLAMHAIAEVQKTGGICAFIDAEHAFDRSYAQVSVRQSPGSVPMVCRVPMCSSQAFPGGGLPRD